MSDQFIEHWRQVTEFNYPALQAWNERLAEMHRKAVAEAVILTEEKADRDEEIERLREALGWAQRQVNGCIEYASYIDNDRSTVGSGALLADLRTADDQIEKVLARQALAQAKGKG